MSQMETRECQADVDAVEVYARGALVRRTLTLPEDLPAEGVSLVVKGATPWLEPGSLRAELEGERMVVGVRTVLRFPTSLDDPGALRAELDALLRTRDELSAEVQHLEAARARLLAASVQPSWKAKRLSADPAARFGDALGAIELVDDVTATVEEQLLSAIAALQSNREACRELELRWQQASHGETRDAQTPTRDLVVTLAQGQGSVSALRVTYAVMRAQWWPAYALRLSPGGRDGAISADAFVAQATGEDWAGVQLSLCSGDLVDELALPEMQSWRLGRRQRRRAPGFRPLPSDLDALFEGYERVFQELDGGPVFGGSAPPTAQPVAAMAPPPPAPLARPAPQAAGAVSYAEPVRAEAAALEEEVAMFAAADMPAQAKSRSLSVGRSFSRGGGGPPGGAMPVASRQPVAPPPPEAPADGWLNFDALSLRDPRLGGRGKLELVAPAAGAQPYGTLTPPARVSDPLRTRGTFDHRWRSEARCDLASDGVPRRTAIVGRDTPCRQRLRCVPVETTEVYREVEIDNPFEAPLLAGPIDVFLDGALLRTSPLETVDRGGVIRVGLGQEERVTVVRKVRARESSKGLLGGTTHVVHDVEIELASALGEAIDVDVLDRLPVTDDKEVNISVLGSDPTADSYDGAARGQPVRGGLSWRVPLQAGGASRLTFSYAVDLDAKLELVGGNRRD